VKEQKLIEMIDPTRTIISAILKMLIPENRPKVPPEIFFCVFKKLQIFKNNNKSSLNSTETLKSTQAK
jgi:hypothetical protein